VNVIVGAGASAATSIVDTAESGTEGVVTAAIPSSGSGSSSITKVVGSPLDNLNSNGESNTIGSGNSGNGNNNGNGMYYGLL
jgi:hypothetical protein